VRQNHRLLSVKLSPTPRQGAGSSSPPCTSAISISVVKQPNQLLA
jgi:hypothetical protein